MEIVKYCSAAGIKLNRGTKVHNHYNLAWALEKLAT
jgi:hypothetical protein